MTICIAILDMDGTLLFKRSIDVLCEELGLTENLAQIDRVSASLPASKVSEEIAKFFEGQPRARLEEIFDSIPLNHGVHDFMRFLKQNQFLIAIATDSYQFLAERLSRKIGADAVYGHIVEIREGILTGRLLTKHRCLKVEGCREYSTCKLWFMRRLTSSDESFTVTVGDGDSDFCMMTEANVAIAYRPKSQRLTKVARFVASSFPEIEHILSREIATTKKQQQYGDAVRVP
jgi:HAD superfamily phosphoserine phosphatase-like hydrolase